MKLSLIYFFVPALVSCAATNWTREVSASQSTSSTPDTILDFSTSGGDWLGIRWCALHWNHMRPCDSIGTKGPVKKISWMDTTLNVLDGYYKFDRRGKLQEVCGRGRVDFAGWHCRTKFEKFSDPLHLLTELDLKGRITRQQHSMSDKTKFNVCKYDDLAKPAISECDDGDVIQTYTYDKSGRPLTYSRRRIPAPNETQERRIYLNNNSALYALYFYNDDDHGNWTEYQIIYQSGLSSKPMADFYSATFQRNIEYY